MLKLLNPEETRENVRDHIVEETENETRSFYTPSKSVRINSTQNDDHRLSRNRIHLPTSSFEKCFQAITFFSTGKNYQF